MNNKNKIFQTTLLSTTLLAALASGTCSYGMVQWKQGESSSQASSSSSATCNASQETPRHQQELAKPSNFHEIFKSVPTELQRLILEFAGGYLKDSIKTDSNSLTVMRHVTSLMHMDTASKGLKDMKLVWATKFGKFLHKSHDKNLALNVIQKFRNHPHSNDFLRYVAHAMYPYVHGPDTLKTKAQWAGHEDGGIREWELQLTTEKSGAEKIITSFFASNEKKIWNTSGTLLEELQLPNSFYFTEVNPKNGKLQFFVFSRVNETSVFTDASGKTLDTRPIEDYPDKHNKQTFRDPSDEKLKTVKTSFGTLKIFDTATGDLIKERYDLDPAEGDFIKFLEIVPDISGALKIATISCDGHVRLYSTSGEVSKQLSLPNAPHTNIKQVVIDPADKKLKILYADIIPGTKNIKMLDVETKTITIFEEHEHNLVRPLSAQVFIDPVDGVLKIICYRYTNNAPGDTTITVYDTRGTILATFHYTTFKTSPNACINPMTNQINIFAVDNNGVTILDSNCKPLAVFQDTSTSPFSDVKILPTDKGIRIVAVHKDYTTITTAELPPDHYDANLEDLVTQPGTLRQLARTIRQKFSKLFS